MSDIPSLLHATDERQRDMYSGHVKSYTSYALYGACGRGRLRKLQRDLPVLYPIALPFEGAVENGHVRSSHGIHIQSNRC